jgi:hypothetical protein
VIEKLLENWLDSASERSYQSSFIQMLSGQGYRVLHSTRHCSLEYGKDVIAIAPDGVPCAYQLKGDPGGRLGLSHFRSEIQPQLVQLMSQPIVFPGVPTDVPHRSFLVSNGYFEEEVQRAIDDLNRGSYLSKVELIGRGQLLDWAKQLGSNLWPSEMANVRELLEIFLHDGRDLLPLPRLASILGAIFALRADDKSLKRAELQRAATSAALLTGIATQNFAKADNNYALVSAWCLFAVNLISASDRSALSLQDSTSEALLIAESTIKDALVDLWNEAQTNPHLVEGDALSDTELYRWRYTLLVGLFSTLWFFPGSTAEDIERRRHISQWLKRKHDHLELWGEGAVSCLLAYLFFLRRADATLRPDSELASLFELIVTLNQAGSSKALPDPYYGFEDIARSRYGLTPSTESSNLQEDTFGGSSYTAELVLHLVARARLKLPCRINWPNFNRLGHKRFVPAASWQYCLLKCPEGVEETRQYQPEYSWAELCKEAASETCDYLPSELAQRPHLLLLWVIIAPHRLTSDIGRFLSARLPRF